MKTTFPTLIDSTKRTSFVECPYKFYNQWIKLLTPVETSIDLHAGGAWAAGLERTRNDYYYLNVPFEAAFMNGIWEVVNFWGDYEIDHSHNKTLPFLLAGFDAYWKHYGPLTDEVKPYRLWDKATVEVSFSIPIPDTKHPETGDPILYAGRMDMIAAFQNKPWVFDDKTTSQLGPSWADKWAMRGQFLGYQWAIQETLGIELAGTIVRGTSFLKYKNEFQQKILPIKQWKIEQYAEQLSRDVNRMIDAYNTGYWDKSFGDACERYRGCPMDAVCDTQNPEHWEKTLYKRNTWNPLNKNPEEEK